MEEREIMSLSENDITPEPEEPIPGTDPGEGEAPPTEGEDPPTESTDPPAEGTDPPAEGEDPPTEGTDPPVEGTDPPVEGGDPPAEGTDPPAEGNTMQEILDGLRESLDKKDADVESLTESIRSLTDIMSARMDTSVTDLPFNGWRDWWYPVRMEFTVHPYGAGYDMKQSERIETPEALLARYNELLSLCNDGGTLKYFYVRYIYDDIDSDTEILVYDYEAKDEPVQEITVPFEGWEGWSYPISVDFTVHPWGAGYDMDVTETYDTPEAFKTRYGENVELCKDGGTLKDFYVRLIRDGSGETVYDLAAQTPEPDPGDGTAELLLSHLESINTTLEGMVRADLEYRESTADYQDQMLKMQAAGTATNIFICIGVFAIFAAMIWQQFLGRFK